jgi:hypothetical protein
MRPPPYPSPTGGEGKILPRKAKLFRKMVAATIFPQGGSEAPTLSLARKGGGGKEGGGKYQ